VPPPLRLPSRSAWPRPLSPGFLPPCPYLGLPWGLSPPRCPRCNTAASSPTPLTGSLAGGGRGVGGARCRQSPSPQRGAAVALGDTGCRSTRTWCWHRAEPPSFGESRGGRTDLSGWAPPGTPALGCSPAPRRWHRGRRPWLCRGLKQRAPLTRGRGDRGWHRGHPLPTL